MSLSIDKINYHHILRNICPLHLCNIFVKFASSGAQRSKFHTDVTQKNYTDVTQKNYTDVTQNFYSNMYI